MNDDFNQPKSHFRAVMAIILSIPAAFALMAVLGFGTRYFVALPGLLGLVRQPPMVERTAVSVPDQLEVELTRTGKYIILVDRLLPLGREYDVTHYEVTLLSPNQEPIEITSTAQVSWDTQDLYGTRLYEFEIEQAGTYIFSVESSQPSDSWTILPNYGPANQRILVLFYGGMMALIYGIWSWRERHLDRHRKANAQKKGEKFDKWLDGLSKNVT